MLEGKNIYFRYKKNMPWVLTNAEIVIHPGEIVGLSGYSGQGKTTLGKILGGYFSPIKGAVRLDSRPLPAKGFSPVQMVFQHPERVFNPQLQLKDSLEEAGALSRVLLDEFQVETEWLQRRPHELSGGELQRMAISRALTKKNRFMIADEITTMLDVLSQANIWDTICRYVKQQNIGVLIISHDLPLMERLCDRILNISGIQSPE